VGLAPAALVLMIRFWVPESPRWLLRMGRMEEARRSLASALQIDPQNIDLPTSIPDEVKPLPWRQLFRYPRSVAAACLTAISQTGGAALLLWIATLFVLVLRISTAEGGGSRGAGGGQGQRSGEDAQARSTRRRARPDTGGDPAPGRCG
jgi:putative MFS transporter